MSDSARRGARVRKCGDVRAALRAAFVALDATELAGGAATYRDVARQAQVGLVAAEHTVANMRRAGELVHVGEHKPAGERVYTKLYALAIAPTVPPAAPDPTKALAGLMAALHDVARRQDGPQ